MKKLHELKDKLIDEIEEYNDKGRLSKDDALTLKALTGSADHLCNIIEGESGYSGHYMPWAYEGDRSYNDRSYNDRSYARRDSRGRYSSEGYSRHGLADKLRDLMDEAPDEQTRMEIKRLVDKM